MKVVPMEDFVLHQRDERKSMDVTRNLTDFRSSVIAYANFLKTPMRHEHFHGSSAIVKIEHVYVLTRMMHDDPNENRGLLFVPDQGFPGEDLRPVEVPDGEMFTSLSQSRYNCSLTEHGVKLIFG